MTIGTFAKVFAYVTLFVLAVRGEAHDVNASALSMSLLIGLWLFVGLLIFL